MSIAKDMKEFIKELTALCNKRRMRIISSEYYMYLEPFERRVLSIEMQINEHCFVSEEVIEKED